MGKQHVPGTELGGALIALGTVSGSLIAMPLHEPHLGRFTAAGWVAAGLVVLMLGTYIDEKGRGEKTSPGVAFCLMLMSIPLYLLQETDSQVKQGERRCRPCGAVLNC